jgi:hypothetical protein
MSLIKKFFGIKSDANDFKNKMPAKHTEYTEADNIGTRVDSLAKANGIWIFRCIGEVDPFLLYVFDCETAAHDALLDLGWIHLIKEIRSLISTEPIEFGYYPTENGKYEAMLYGMALTHEMWHEAKRSFVGHGGIRKNEREPIIQSHPDGVRSVIDAGSVGFVREEHRAIMGHAMMYKIYHAPNRASAREFLTKNRVTQKFCYVCVETPEGNLGRDIEGMFEYEGSM